MRIVDKSLTRTLLTTLLLIAILPVGVVAYLLINASSQALTRQMESYVLSLAASKAQEIELKLEQVQSHTEIAAQAARLVLQLEMWPEAIAARMSSYEFDERGVLGLPAESYSAQRALFPEGVISNVFVARTVELTLEMQEDIVTTESLEVIWQGIQEANLNTRRVYLTTTGGMMRTYPWISNDVYPADWDPRDAVFFTAATPANNPGRRTVWTSSYLDADGQSWMVTVSIPVYDNQDNFLGVVSQDITIASLMEVVLQLQLPGSDGYGFLIDGTGKVIAHPNHTYTGANLVKAAGESLAPIARRMSSEHSGLSSFDDGAGLQTLAFARVPNTDWRLAIVVPQRAVTSPAIAMRHDAIVLSLVVVGIVTAVALILSHQITHPLRQLMYGVERIGQGDLAHQVSLKSENEIGRLAEAFNAMAARLRLREQDLHRQIAAMRIQIDEVKKNHQVSRITETDYFRYLQQSAQQMRAMLADVSEQR
jgi:HAMP domain-containing protein